MTKVNGLVLGGAMANTFLVAQVRRLGPRLLSLTWLRQLSGFWMLPDRMAVSLLPRDVVVVELKLGATHRITKLMTLLKAR